MSIPTNPPGWIHVAGILDRPEAEMLIQCGVSWLGFPLVLGYHREDLSVEEAAAIAAVLGRQANFFLITYLDTAVSVIELCRRLGVECVQLHGPIETDEMERLRQAWPDLRVIKSLVVSGDNLDDLSREVMNLAPLVDAFITDTFDSATGACGATGKTHDWAISRRLVELSPKPVILAGGLTADNVFDAVRAVRPAGVDVHTGIEGPDGRKHPDLARRFVCEAHRAFRA